MNVDNGSSGMTQASVRARNLALVYHEVLTSNEEAVSRADIAARLGMTRSTVSRLIDDLILGDLVEEGTAVGGSRGRPAVPLRAQPGSVFALGLEVNVERMVAALVDLTGEVRACHHLDAAVDELPLDENTPPGKNILKAEKLAVLYILEKRGLPRCKGSAFGFYPVMLSGALLVVSVIYII